MSKRSRVSGKHVAILGAIVCGAAAGVVATRAGGGAQTIEGIGSAALKGARIGAKLAPVLDALSRASRGELADVFGQLAERFEVDEGGEEL